MNREAPTPAVSSQPQRRESEATTPQQPLAQTLCIDSARLFAGGATELLIDHRGVLYRLKQTSLGKLILTK